MKMEVKEGYKNTEVGVIPEDWEVRELGEFANVSSGGTPNREVDSYWNGHIPWITTSQINFNIIKEATEFITNEGLYNSSAKLFEAGTLLMAMYGQGKTRGKVAILGINATTNQACSAIQLNKAILKEYIFCNLAGRYDEIRSLSNTGSQENLSSGLIKKILIPLPPLPEQTAIATVLSDTDSLIQALEKKIAKKQLIKKGAMQELLKAKEGWEVKMLGEIADIKTGSRNNQDKEIDGEYPLFVRSQTIERINSYSYDCEAILIPGEGGIGSIYHYINGKFDVHQRVYKISNFLSNVNGKFIYLFLKKNFNQHAMKNSVKATVDSLRLPTFLEFEIALPSLQEQTHIAQSLFNMDTEIEILENKLSKYKQLKQGLMQELLTGRIRLV